MVRLHIDLSNVWNSITLTNKYIKVYQIGFQLQNWFIYAILTCQKVLDCSVNAISLLLFKIRDYQCWLKNMYNLRIVLSFVWGKMRTAAQEAASQIALRDCSKVSVGESQYIRFWWRESSVPWSIPFYKRFFVSHENLMSPWRDLCFSRREEMQGLR